MREKKIDGNNKYKLSIIMPKKQSVCPLMGNYDSFKKMAIVKHLNIEFLLRQLI